MMKSTVTSLSFAFGVGGAILCLSGAPAAACGYDTLDGSICYTAGSYCPEGFYALTGQQLSIYQDQALYSLIGSYYGGDWKTVYNVPNLLGVTPAAYGSGAGLEPIGYAQKYGVTAGTMSYANMPVHTHVATLGVDSSRMSMTASLQASGQTGTAVMPSTGNSTLAGISNSAKLWAAATGANPVKLGGWLAPPAGGFTPDARMVNSAVGQGMSFPVQPPGIGLTACIGSSDKPYPSKP